MARGGPLGSGAALGLALLTGALVTGCADSGTRHGAPTDARDETRTASASPSPSATPPEELCARVVAYWSREVLDEDTYGDYQSMGLSNGQYEILMAVVDAARAEKQREGDGAARQLIHRQAAERCRERYRDGGPTGGPWS
ncbi:hypothetical protein [Streptomyces sp. PSKA30]|uniref:hypothetical protein n=1 Tax=Streptomyces sp. PSKA30 TaxID=2874597 RepID=UPI001CD17C2D|nr:hypothetical protein [Streptomyces sp. PSKA30]MBZ9643224.1 hypothetical protein [Streptomyces sp. PSKA30]